MQLKILGLIAAGIAGIVVGAPPAQAMSIEITGFVVTPISGGFDYQYTMSLTPGDSLNATTTNGNSLFVFYDLNALLSPNASFSAGSTATADWSVVVENTSGSWAGGLSTLTSQGGTAIEPDSAAISNVRFQYVGAGFSSGASTSLLGVAHIFSSQAPGVFAQYAARWVDNASGRTQVNTDTPQGPGTITTTIPVPAAALTGITALGSLAIVSVLRKRRR